MNRVVITGAGIISPLGNSMAEMAESLKTGKSAIAPLTLVPSETLNYKIAAEVHNFDPAAQFPHKHLSLLDRCAQLGLAASRQAVVQSGIDFRAELGARAAAIIGTGVGNINTAEETYRRLYLDCAKRVHPLTIPKFMFSSTVSHISIEYGITGPSFMVASACASANHAIGLAFQMVRSGVIDAAVSGGTESVFNIGTLKGWEALRIMAPDTCRPFSKGRAGMVLGEGAGIFVLENRERALARGAEILGEIVGFGMTSDATDIVMPSASGSTAAMEACLKDAGLNPEDIDYINAHGTGTQANDAIEAKAITTVFGERASGIPVSSTKSMHGHALGSSGALELAAILIAQRDSFIPPTANYVEPDPECDLDVVPNEARDAKIDVVLSNAFAFGGLNAVLAIRKA